MLSDCLPGRLSAWHQAGLGSQAHEVIFQCFKTHLQGGLSRRQDDVRAGGQAEPVTAESLAEPPFRPVAIDGMAEGPSRRYDTQSAGTALRPLNPQYHALTGEADTAVEDGLKRS